MFGFIIKKSFLTQTRAAQQLKSADFRSRLDSPHPTPEGHQGLCQSGPHEKSFGHRQKVRRCETDWESDPKAALKV